MWGGRGFSRGYLAALAASALIFGAGVGRSAPDAAPPAAAAADSAVVDSAVVDSAVFDSATVDTSGPVPQRDIFDVAHDLFRGPRLEPEVQLRPRAGLSWVALPSLSYNPLYGVALGVSANAAGPLGDPESTRISALSIGGNYSTTGQIQAQARGDLVLHDNRILLRLDGRYLDTSRPTWGLGPAEDGQQEYGMDYRLTRFFFTVYREVGSAVYAGIGIHRDDYFDIVDERAVAGEATPYTDYSGGQVDKSGSTGISINLMNDERDNPVNPRRGYYLSSSFRTYADGGAGGSWQEMLLDFRTYPTLPQGSRNRLCFWVQSWFTFGRAPYLSLPQIGGDTYNRSGRGYVMGRIRSQSLVSAEVEYRFDVRCDGLLGAVAFMSLTSVTEPVSGVFGRRDLAGGVGLRIKFNKRSDTNLTIDAGWGEHGSFGMFLGTTEAF